MARKRALKDAAKDPVAEKAPALRREKEASPSPTPLWVIAAAFAAGLIGGVITSRFFRIL